MSTIEDVRAREILDSRGNPTLEVEVELYDGTTGQNAFYGLGGQNFKIGN